MKFIFKAQKHQLDAVNSVISVFKGQERFKKKKDGKNFNLFKYYSNNRLILNDEQILNNVQKVQKENKINISDKLKKENNNYNLDISMETGTGKTYTYIKTIFELNKNYGWTKFIVVVPSSAIKLGVNQSFKDTENHFYDEYYQKIKSFIYDSKNLHYIRDFATNSGINVMIITMQSFAESNRNRVIYEERDNLNSNSPIDVISNVNPIIIRDEPQRMGGKITKNALENFNPLFFLNYSATHRDIHNLIYDLDSLDAYRNKLVKRIEVKGIELVSLSGTNCYLYLDRIEISKEKPPLAKVEFEKKNKNNEITRVSKKLKQGDDLYLESGNLQSYKGIKIHEIKAKENSILLSNGAEISIGQSISNSNDDFQRIQIRETISAHFEKEKELYTKNIKVLSLFFLDDISNYRQYEENNTTLGTYGKIFEDEYKEILNSYLIKDDIDSEYKEYLKHTQNNISKVHNGYFSKDKTTKKDQDKENDKVYSQILNDKKSLLDLKNPLRFIFTKYALREGWDCPNIFQICTLKHSSDEITKRQEIGRGMRLCVDQKGNRIDNNTSKFDVNTLTVIANESYDSFIQGLQSEYDKDYSDKNKNQNTKDTIHDARDKIKIKIDKNKKEKFKDLWELIKPKYTYRIKLDNKKVVKEIAEEFKKAENMPEKTSYKVITGSQSDKSSNKINFQSNKSYATSDIQSTTTYDLIKEIGNQSNLTRKTTYEILKNIGGNFIKKFAINPQSFIKTLCDVINKIKIKFTKENISYKTTKLTHSFSIFKAENIYRNDNIQEFKKSLQNYIQLDSNIEKRFAEDLSNSKNITVYTKLPKKFKIPTPIGNYTPDWAIVFENDFKKQIYFVVETKGTTNPNQLRQNEKYKIDYAKQLFKFIKDTNKNKTIKYEICDSLRSIFDSMPIIRKE